MAPALSSGLNLWGLPCPITLQNQANLAKVATLVADNQHLSRSLHEARVRPCAAWLAAKGRMAGEDLE